eukprot:scaffold670854_cov46-Prasinocladus_malaysianus.AAC.1
MKTIREGNDLTSLKLWALLQQSSALSLARNGGANGQQGRRAECHQQQQRCGGCPWRSSCCAHRGDFLQQIHFREVKADS